MFLPLNEILSRKLDVNFQILTGKLLIEQMISAEAPVLFAKAAEIFINELTLRSWIHAEENKRRTLQVHYDRDITYW